VHAGALPVAEAGPAVAASFEGVAGAVAEGIEAGADAELGEEEEEEEEEEAAQEEELSEQPPVLAVAVVRTGVGGSGGGGGGAAHSFGAIGLSGPLLRETSLPTLRLGAMRLFGADAAAGGQAPAVAVGMSAVKRKVDYVFDTVDRVFSSNPGASPSFVLVVHLADFDDAWATDAAARLQREHADEVATGKLHGIRAPRSLYPNLDVCPPLCPHAEGPEEGRWRSKRNIDYALLMAYSAPLAQYYLQIEDDLSFTLGWVATALNYAREQPELTKESNAPWRVIDFTGSGCSGKMMQSNELPRLAQLYLLFYDQLHCEAGLVRWMRSMTSGAPVEYFKTGEKLFKHEGLIDSNGGNHVTQVSCGGHSAPSCPECPSGKGEGFCHGDCTWVGDACIGMSPGSSISSAAQPVVQQKHQQSAAVSQPTQVAAPPTEEELRLRRFDNPPAWVISDMTVVPTFLANFAYVAGGEGQSRNDVCDSRLSPALRRPSVHGQRCWFWAKAVSQEQHIIVAFNAEITMEALEVSFGHDAHSKDVLVNGLVEVSESSQQSAMETGSAGKCGDFRTLKEVHGEREISWEPGASGPIAGIRCVRISMAESQTEWLIVRRILVKSL